MVGRVGTLSYSSYYFADYLVDILIRFKKYVTYILWIMTWRQVLGNAQFNEDNDNLKKKRLHQ